MTLHAWCGWMLWTRGLPCPPFVLTTKRKKQPRLRITAVQERHTRRGIPDQGTPSAVGFASSSFSPDSQAVGPHDEAYRQDFVAIASLVTNGDPASMAATDITRDVMRLAFAAYSASHEAASIRRCWSTWNVLCVFLYIGEHLSANPMPLVGRPKLPKSLPEALPHSEVEVLLETVAQDRESSRKTDWAERDLAIILTGLLAGLRADELRNCNVGDIRTMPEGGAVIHVKGKGGKERSIPIEPQLLSIIEAYLDSRSARLPEEFKRSSAAHVRGLHRWPARSPLFVGRDGEWITRGTPQSRMKRAFKLAGPDAQAIPGALIHGLRDTQPELKHEVPRRETQSMTSSE